MRQLARDLAQRRLEAERLLGRLAGLQAVAERRAAFDDLLADLEQRQVRADRAAVVCIVGSSGAGKSTLLNALAGDNVATEGVHRPTTSRPTIYVPDDADTKTFALDLEAGAELVTYQPGAAAHGWSGQVFIDAPDWNSIATEHHEIARRMVARADVLLVLMHRQSIREEVAIEFLRPFTDKRRHMVFVLGRADELTPDHRQELTAQVEETTARELGFNERPPVFAIDARSAKSDPNGAIGFRDLLDYLGTLADSSILEQIRRSGLLADERRLHELATACHAATNAVLTEIPTMLRHALETATTTLRNDIESDLSLREADLEAGMAERSGRTWRGPGGLALRFGWSTGGVGLGLLIARRHPLTAAAATGATLIAGATHKILRQHRLSKAPDQIGNHGSSVVTKLERDLAIPMMDLSAVTRRAFIDEDAAARALGDGIFDPTAHARRLADIADASWQDAVQRELPRKAREAIPGPLRLVLDLPFYALAVHALGYHVLGGYFQGRPAGFDFLLNTALIAGLWGVAMRYIARFWIRHRARQLCTEFGDALTIQLSASTETSVAQLESELATVARDLQNLAGIGTERELSQ